MGIVYRYNNVATTSEMCHWDAGNIPVGVRMSESGNSSKFDVSSMLLISMGMAAGLSLEDTSVSKRRPFDRPKVYQCSCTCADYPHPFKELLWQL